MERDTLILVILYIIVFGGLSICFIAAYLQSKKNNNQDHRESGGA